MQGFQMIPALRRSFTPETLDMVCNDPSYDLTKHNPRQMSTGLPPSGEYLGGE